MDLGQGGGCSQVGGQSAEQGGEGAELGQAGARSEGGAEHAADMEQGGEGMRTGGQGTGQGGEGAQGEGQDAELQQEGSRSEGGSGHAMDLEQGGDDVQSGVQGTEGQGGVGELVRGDGEEFRDDSDTASLLSSCCSETSSDAGLGGDRDTEGFVGLGEGRHTAQHYQQLLDTEVWGGSPAGTLRQWLCYMLEWKVRHNCTDEGFDDLLKILERTSPQPNIIPPSLHLVQRIMGCKQLWELEHHVCPCHKHYYKPLDPKHWTVADEQQQQPQPPPPPQQQQQQQQHEVACPVCGTARFRISVLPGGKRETVPHMVSEYSA